ncbi:MAG TPA: lysophospholipid acyltransferase family protein, partial [Armatimonadota bacterium]|nr:lysophospholipid acyltransferase family protein [Armatimonadota bacterium]
MRYYLFVRKLLWRLFRLFGRIQVEGGQYVPATGSVILAPNHQSLCDPPVVGAAVLRPLFFMAKEELFRIPLLGWQIRHLNAFPVRRNAADRAALRHAEHLLAAGEAVVIFPEGYVSKTGEMQEFHSGVALIALRTGAPV